MTLYDLTTLQIAVTAHASTLQALERALPAAGGRLLGCWTSDVGMLNQVFVLRAFDDPAALWAAREALLAGEAPLGVGEGLESVDAGTYAPFPFLPPIAPGRHGRCYELRTYGLKHGRLPATIAAWRDAVPARSRISPLVGALHALDGTLPRFLNIWAYPSADARAAARTEAVSQKVWPPVGGPANLTQMRSTLAVPAPFSPLQ